MTETKIQHFISLIDKITKESNNERKTYLINSLKSELEGDNDSFDINEKEYDGTTVNPSHKTVLSFAAEENLIEIVQQVFDMYADKISAKTLTHALAASCKSDSNYDSAKAILQHLEGTSYSIKDALPGILGITFALGGCKIYGLILEYVVKQGYGDIIDDQFTKWFKFSNKKEFVKLILQHGNKFLSKEKINEAFLEAIKENKLKGLELLTEHVEKKISSECIEELFEDGIKNQNNEFLELVAKFKDKISSDTISRIFSQIGSNQDPNNNNNVYENVKLVLQYGPVSKINEKSIKTVFISAALTANKKIFDLFLSHNINIPKIPLRVLSERSDVTSNMKLFLQDNFLLGGNNLQQPPVMNNKPQPTITTSPQQKQPINGVPQTVASNATPLQQSLINPQTTNTTTPQQKQPISGDPQTVTGSATLLHETPVDNGSGNNEPPITTHNSKQEHFLGISPRGWILIATCAIAGALALYFLAPLILGATVGISAQLGFGATGAAMGGGIGYLSDIAISKCCSEPAVQPA